MLYPKIETLWNRGPDFKVRCGDLRCPEFRLVRGWFITEKIDGMNVRVWLHADGSVTYHGRTEDAQMPPHLLTWLQEHLPAPIVGGAFEPGVEAILFGEGYGEKIQSGGGVYRTGVSFRLFDVFVYPRWWLQWGNVMDVAQKCGVCTVPALGANYDDTNLAVDHFIHSRSHVARAEGGTAQHPLEGIVARTDPLLFDARGSRIMWKLKARDLP